MKKQNLYILGCLVLLSILALVVVQLFAEEPLQIRTSGGKGIDRGFVFWEGNYIEAPYQVESRDLAVFINGIQITRKLKWPPRDQRVSEDPGMPVGVTPKAGLAALDTVRGPNDDPHMGLKIRYLYQHFQKEEAREKIIEYFKALPYIKSLESIHKYILRLEDYYGETRLVDISYVEIGPPPTRAEYESAVEKTKKDIILYL